MKYLLITALLLAPAVFSQESKSAVAQVDFRQIGDLLKQVVLSDPEQHDLRDALKKSEQAQAEMQQRMQKAILNGDTIEPEDLTDTGIDMVENMKHRKKLEALSQKELIEVIEASSLGKQYDVILKKDLREAVMFSSIPIDDITAIVRQELLKRLKPAE